MSEIRSVVGEHDRPKARGLPRRRVGQPLGPGLLALLWVVFDPCLAPAQPQQHAPLPVEQPRQPTPFDRGAMRVTFGGGGGVYDGATYVAIAAGFSYFVWHGIELGVDLTQWFGSDPNVTQLSPQLRYIFYQLAPISPYVGLFYRHWFRWAGLSDFDTIGGRVGAVWQVGGRLLIGLGVAYERVLNDCEEGCSAVYPEVTLGVMF